LGLSIGVTYLVDNNVISYFFNAGVKRQLTAIADVLPLAVVREVHDEAAKAAFGNEYKNWQSTSKLKLVDLLVGGPGSKLLTELRRASSSLKDLGEHASIALAAEDKQYVFVANDKNALWIALRELYEPREVVIRLSTFLRRVADANAMTKSCAIDIAKKSQLEDALPTWWANWLATLPP
jgi:hypothetical protein